MIKNPYLPDDHHQIRSHARKGTTLILIIDDDVKMAGTLERFLRYAGMEAVSVASGMEALAMLHVRRPQLIVLDWHLPGMHGEVVLQAIRADAAYGQVPVLVYSAEFSRAVEQEALREGAQGFIVKGTMGMERMLERIKELLEEGRGRLRLVD